VRIAQGARPAHWRVCGGGMGPEAQRPAVAAAHCDDRHSPAAGRGIPAKPRAG